MRRGTIAMAGMALMAVMAVEAGEAWARAGAGGSRGSRSFSAPAAPRPATPAPGAPSRSQDVRPTPATPASPMAQRPGLLGGLMGGLGGLVLGGLIGSMLFGGLGHGLGGGLGLLEIALLAGGAWLLFSMLRRRTAAGPQPAYAGAGGSAYGRPTVTDAPSGGGTVAPEAPAAGTDLERGLGHIAQMDRDFSPTAVEEAARDTFRVVQAALTLGDLSVVTERLTPEMRASLQAQCDRLRASNRTNRTAQVEFRQVEVSEAWQETGQDFVTVYLSGSMLDYTVDAAGTVVDGSSTTPVAFEEWWTFTRPVGPHRWRLTAIQAG